MNIKRWERPNEGLNNSFQASCYRRVIMPQHNFWFGRNSRDETRSTATGPFFFARLSRAVIGWPCKEAIVGKRKGKTCSARNLGWRRERSYCAEFACACLSDRHLASYCVVVHRVETLKVQQSARLMYVFSGEQNVTVFTAKKPILCQWSVPIF